ncbi:hypothetical protein [Pseudonocardia sp. TRM90224]|uniref:hypothetical protein n=1 Tax=Pseudonocardia sp. TRM90224 TaxID=2812678 RepID=UPI001E327DA4|nr:hypothetical protein [Pseudonocardia sp. TRM90224]
MTGRTMVERRLSSFVVGFEAAPTLRGRWRARGLAPTGRPPFAMRMTGDGIELRGSDGTPVVLPWAQFDGFRLRSTFGRPVLEPVIAPGAAAPPIARLGVDRLGVALLDQPLDAIDYGLRHFSGGRAGVVRG